MVASNLRDTTVFESVHLYLLPHPSLPDLLLSPASLSWSSNSINMTLLFCDCSVREICGKEDIDIAYKHFKAFYQTFSSIDRKLIVD